MNKQTRSIFVSFLIIMVVLGASDSLRGIFTMVFQEHFKLSVSQLSLIITVSYIGNLIFLFFGGSFLDRTTKKKAILTILCIWMAGALIFLSTDNYIFLLIGMFLCMGASTLINTMINILVPVIFTASPGLIVNLLFFVQGTGTSGSQNILGRITVSFTAWKMVNLVLILLAVVGSIIIFVSKIPMIVTEEKKQEEGSQYLSVIKRPAFWFFTLIFGFYFIGEHGILNWFLMYATKEHKLSSTEAALYLSLFFGGITVGRLALAPVVHRFGAAKSIAALSCLGTSLYMIGIVFGSNTFFLLSLSGFCLSIVYPTLVLLIQNYFEKDRISTAIGTIISLATVFDIGFNFSFGKLIDYASLSLSFYILPISMLLFCVVYLCFLKFMKPIHT